MNLESQIMDIREIVSAGSTRALVNHIDLNNIKHFWLQYAKKFSCLFGRC